MKKRIISVLCAVAMVVSAAVVPVSESGISLPLCLSASAASTSKIALSGYIWEDKVSGKNTQSRNGLYDLITNGIRDDIGINGMDVQLVNNKTHSTYHAFTDDNGYYKFDDISINDLANYSVKIDYNGLDYATVSPNKDNLSSNFNASSKADEDNKKRNSLNLTNSWIYTHENSGGYDKAFREKIMSFSYDGSSAGSLINAMEYSLKVTEALMLKALDSVCSPESCIDFFVKYELPLHFYGEKENFGSKYNSGDYDEGFLYIKVNDINGINNLFDEWLSSIKRNAEKGRFYTIEYYNEVKDTPIEEYIETVKAEIDRRKTVNLQMLADMGIE